MSFNDDKFGSVFPTRNGQATGTANERQMLDNLGGSGSFRTKVQVSPDGNTTTILRTKNGQPQFDTTTVQPAPVKGTKTGDLLLTWAMFNTRNHDTTFKLAVINTDTLDLIDTQPMGAIREIGDSGGLYLNSSGISAHRLFNLGNDAYAIEYKGYQGGGELQQHFMFGSKVLDMKKALTVEFPHGYPNLPSEWGEYDYAALHYHVSNVGINGVPRVGFAGLWAMTAQFSYQISRTVWGIKSTDAFVYSLMQSQDWSDGTARVYVQEWSGITGSPVQTVSLVPALHSEWSAGGTIATDSTRVYVTYYTPVSGESPVPVTKVYKAGLVLDGSHSLPLSSVPTACKENLDWYMREEDRFTTTPLVMTLTPYPWSEWAPHGPRSFAKHAPFFPDVLITTVTHVMFLCLAGNIPYDKASTDLPLHNDGSYSALKVLLHVYTVTGTYVKTIELDQAAPFAPSDPQGSASDPAPQEGITYFVRPVRTVAFPQMNGGAIFLTKPLASLK